MKSQQKSKRTKTIKARVSEQEYAAIREKLAGSGLTESAFVRHALLGVEISGTAERDRKAALHMCRAQTLLNEARGKLNDPVLDEIQEEVSQICQCLL